MMQAKSLFDDSIGSIEGFLFVPQAQNTQGWKRLVVKVLPVKSCICTI